MDNIENIVERIKSEIEALNYDSENLSKDYQMGVNAGLELALYIIEQIVS